MANEKIAAEKNTHLYEVRNLKTSFCTDSGLVQAVDGVSFYVDEGEIVSVVGESGCGKSMTQLSALQLLKMPPGQIESGEAYFQGEDILTYKKNSEQLRQIRGGKIGMIFQEPMTSFAFVSRLWRALPAAVHDAEAG